MQSSAGRSGADRSAEADPGLTGGRWWSRSPGGVTLTVRVTPGARRSEVAERSTARLRVRLAARAVEGQANTELRRFLAEWLGVRSSAVTIVRGERSRDKTVEISGIEAPPA